MRNICWLIIASLATACGGSGGGGGGGGDGDNAPPTVEVLFPSTVALTDGATISVRGRATDTSTISDVSVNGTMATTTDNFANWRVDDVMLVAGANVLTVSATDEHGNADPAAATVTVTRDPAATTTATIGAGPAFSVPRDVVLDILNDTRVLVLDSHGGGEGALVGVDLATGNRTIVSQGMTGGGMPAMLAEPTRMSENPAGGAVYVTEVLSANVVQISTTSGVRAVISDNAMGGAPNFTLPLGIDFFNNTLYWVDFDTPHVLHAPILNGNARVILTDNGIDNMPPLAQPDALVVDGTNNRAFVADLGTPEIQEINLTTQMRTVHASAGVGVGLFGDPRGLRLDLANNRLVTTFPTAAAFVALNNGDRTVFSANGGPGVGPAFMTPLGLAHRIVDQLVYVVEDGYDAVLLVDVVTGDRCIISKG